MSRIYTRKGDEGETSLFGGGRVAKANARVEAYGQVDELNAVLGWCLVWIEDDALRAQVRTVQADLFTIGAHLATPPSPEGRRRPELPELPESRIPDMERWIDSGAEELPELRSFILPGGSPGAAALHVARTVCRRAERRVVELASTESVDPVIVTYLNRLSDLLFQLARVANQRAGEDEQRWEPSP